MSQLYKFGARGYRGDGTDAQKIDANMSAIQPVVNVVELAVPGSGDLTFVYTQDVPAATWVVVHNMNKYPSVSVVDSSGQQVYGEVRYQDLNTVVLVFSAPFGGSANLN